MPPGGHTVRLVDDDHADSHIREVLDKRVLEQLLRRGEQVPRLSLSERLQGAFVRARTLARVDRHRIGCRAVVQRIDLVLLERDQWAHHQRRSIQ